MEACQCEAVEALEQKQQKLEKRRVQFEAVSPLSEGFGRGLWVAIFSGVFFFVVVVCVLRSSRVLAVSLTVYLGHVCYFLISISYIDLS